MRLVATIDCQRSSGMSSSGMPRMLTPALLNSTSSRPKASLVLANSASDRGRLAARRSARPACVPFDLFRHRFELVRAASGEHDRVAVARKRQRRRAADAAARSRHQCDLLRSHRRSPCPSFRKPRRRLSGIHQHGSGGCESAEPEIGQATVMMDCGLALRRARKDGEALNSPARLPGRGCRRGSRRAKPAAALMSAGGPGPAEAVALHRVHAGGAQEQMLLGVLHALGGHPHAQPAAEADDGVHDGGGVGRRLDADARSLKSILSLSNGKRRR